MIVKIPETSNPWIANINGKKYAYPAGTEQDVPAEVANLIREGEGFPPDAHEVQPPFNFPSSGSGLPDPSELADGTAIVKVGEKWKMQEGYGYTEEAFDPITWDGDTEGRPSVGGTYSKVSNNPIRKSEIIGSTLYALIGTDEYSETIEVTEDISDDAYFAGENYSVLVAFAPGELSGMPIPEAGVYFGGAGSGEYSLTAPSTVHQFDPGLIPIIPAAPTEDGTYTMKCTVTDGVAEYAWAADEA